MSELERIRHILQRQAEPSTGVVVAVDPGALRVKTAQGVRALRIDSTDQTRYRVNDRVSIDKDRVSGRFIERLESYQL